MSEMINTESTLIWRNGEPVYIMSCDRTQGHATLEYKGNIFLAYSLVKELWSLQLKSGSFLMGIGNPYYTRGYREALSKEVAFDGDTYVWVRDCFNKCGIHTTEVPVMWEIRGCTFLTASESGLWRLVLPDGHVQVGMGDCAPDSPQMKAVSKKMTDFYSTRFINYISGLFDLLRPIEFETVEQYNDSLHSMNNTSHRKNKRTNWLARLAKKFKRICGGFKFLSGTLARLND